MAYSIHGHTSYILKANSKKTIREKSKEIEVLMLKKLNAVCNFQSMKTPVKLNSL